MDRVNQERDGEHRQREAGEDRDDEDAQGAGARGQRFHVPDARHALVSAEDPDLAANMRPVQTLASQSASGGTAMSTNFASTRAPAATSSLATATQSPFVAAKVSFGCSGL